MVALRSAQGLYVPVPFSERGGLGALMRSLRILLTVPDLNRAASPWREMMGLVNHLPKDRYRVTVCSLRSDGVDDARPLLEAAKVGCAVARFRPGGFGWRNLLGMLKDRRRLLGLGRFDIQHSMDFTASPLEALLARRQAASFVFTQRNMNENASRCLLRVKLRLAKRIACVSESALRLARQLNPQAPLTRIHPGIDLAGLPQRNPSCGRFTVLMVGHVTARKRIADGIRALSLLADVNPNAMLHVAGAVHDRRYFQTMRDLAHGESLVDRVVFHGQHADVPGLMAQSDAFLHTAESEAFGVTLIEAMAVGLPVIAPKIQGPREIVEDGVSGLLVPVGDVAGYAGALRKLMESPELAHNLAAAGRKRVETHFTAQRMAEEYAEFYEAACR